MRMFYRLIGLATIFTTIFLTAGNGSVTAQSSNNVCTTKTHYEEEDLVFSPDSKYLVASWDEKVGSARLWAVETGKVVQTFTNNTPAKLNVSNHIARFAFTSDSRFLLAEHNPFAPFILLWDVRTGQKLYEIAADGEPYDEGTPKIVISPDSKYFLITGNDGTGLFELATGKLLHRSLYGVMHPASFSNDSKYVLMPGDGIKPILWGIDQGMSIGTFASDANYATFIDGGRYVATINHSGDKEFTLWNTATQRKIRSFKIAKQLYQLVWFSADGRYLLAEDYVSGLVLWDTVRSELLHTFTNIAVERESLMFTPDSRYLLVGVIGAEKRPIYHLWAIKRNQERPNFMIDDYGLAAISPNGQYLAVGSYSRNGELRLWDLTSGKELHLDCEK